MNSKGARNESIKLLQSIHSMIPMRLIVRELGKFGMLIIYYSSKTNSIRIARALPTTTDYTIKWRVIVIAIVYLL